MIILVLQFWDNISIFPIVLFFFSFFWPERGNHPLNPRLLHFVPVTEWKPLNFIPHLILKKNLVEPQLKINLRISITQEWLFTSSHPGSRWKRKTNRLSQKFFCQKLFFFSWAPKKRIERKPGEILKLGIDTAHPTKPFKCFFFQKMESSNMSSTKIETTYKPWV